MEIRQCHQANCESQAAYCYTWPGENENFVCPPHAFKIKGIAKAIGMHLEILPLLLEVAVQPEGEIDGD